MGETLYRKYRPQRFADIHGQSGITTTLTNQIRNNRIAHAYLFAGTRGTGKTTSARVFAKAINCHKRGEEQFEPCDVCPSCTDITVGRSVDVIELDAATHTGVDIVREQIIENARFLPTRDRYKIFIIDEVHMLSTSSFNALLKSLEEPPSHVVYILATTELHKVPATVASRCQRFIFRPLPLKVMETKLQSIATAENITVHENVIRRILAASGGAMRDAESLMGQLLALGVTNITETEADVVLPPTLFAETLQFITQLSRNDAGAVFNATQQMFESGIDLQSLHDALTRRAHELMVVRTAGEVPVYLGIFSDSETAQLTGAAKNLQPAWLGKLLEELVEKRALYKTISSPFIPLHLVITQLSAGPVVINPASTPTPVAPQQAQPVKKVETPVVAAPIPAAAPPASAPTDDGFDMPSVSLSDEAQSDSSVSDGPERSQIEKFWPIATQAVINEQPSLGIILASTTILEVTNNNIMLAVKFPMYREKLTEIKVKQRIENRLSELCGTVITYTVTHISEEMSHEPEVTDMLETFGGRVVA